MNLAIDIGNSRTKLGVFVRGVIRETLTVQQLEKASIAPLLTNRLPENVILSSVREPLEARDLDWLSVQGKLIQLDHTTRLPIHNAYGTPETLGKDRLAAVVGAYAMHPGEDILIIDAGTCITFDVLTRRGIFRGGNIAPGLDMRLRAMHTLTARLPLVQTVFPEDKLGRNTETALQNGALRGALYEISGMIDDLKETYSELRVLLTGGDATLLAARLEREIIVYQHLVLQGLNKILEFNVGLSE